MAEAEVLCLSACQRTLKDLPELDPHSTKKLLKNLFLQGPAHILPLNTVLKHFSVECYKKSDVRASAERLSRSSRLNSQRFVAYLNETSPSYMAYQFFVSDLNDTGLGYSE